jgi:hypothetical protein
LRGALPLSGAPSPMFPLFAGGDLSGLPPGFCAVALASRSRAGRASRSSRL